MTTDACPSPVALRAFLDDRLDADTEPQLLAHIDGCTECQRALETLSAHGLPSAVLMARDTLPFPVCAAVVPPRAPDRIGPYRVGKELGHGGMGVVYLGTHTRLRRDAAVKLIRAGASAQPEDVARFRREAESLAAVSHPNVVSVFEVGEQDGVPWLAMEYVPGGSLRASANGQPLPPRDAAAVARGLARGAAAVHAAGIVHRDIKPANVLLARVEGGPPVPKLTDFGLARVLVGAGVTVSGTVMGTPQYMAPEQARASAVGPAGDVYGIGAVLYEALTGRPPFNGTDQIAVLNQVLTRDPVAVRHLQPAVPRDLQTICHKCLEKNPARRYASAAELADDLDRFLGGRPIAARPVGALEAGWRLARRNPVPALLLLLLLLALVGGATGVSWGYVRAEAARSLATEQRERAELGLYYSRVALALREWEQNDAARAEHLLDLCAPAEGRPDRRGWEWHYLKRLCRADVLTVRAHAQAISGLTFSANGATLATSAGDRGYRSDPGKVPGELTLWNGNTFEKLGALTGHTGRVDGTAFDPTGERLVSVGADGTLRVWSVTGRHQLASARLPNNRYWHGAAPAFAPKEPLLAVPVTSGAWLLDAHTLHPRPAATPHTHTVGACAFSGDGALVACAGTSGPDAPGCVIVFETATGNKLCTAPAATQVAAFSGKLLAVANDTDVLLLDARTGDQKAVLRGHTGPVYGLSWSPDGKLLSTCGADQTVRLWQAATGRECRTFRGHRALVTRVAFHPDGRRLASGDAEGVLKVWDVLRDQRGPELIADEHMRSVAFTADGGLRAAHKNNDGGLLAWAADGTPESTQPVRTGLIADWPLRYIALSPDGRFLAGPHPDDTTVAVIWDARTGTPLHTLRGHRAELRSVAFAPDGRTLACSAAGKHGGAHELVLWRLTEGGPPQRTELPCERPVQSLCFSADGARLVAGERGTQQGTFPNDYWTDAHVSVWDVATGTRLNRWAAHPGSVQDVSIDRQGKRIASAGRGGDARVKVWDAETGDQLHDLRAPNMLTCVAFSPDGTRLAAVGYASTVQLWDPATGHEVLTLRATDRHLPEGRASDTHLTFSPSGEKLAVTCWTGTVRVWDGTPTH